MGAMSAQTLQRLGLILLVILVITAVLAAAFGFYSYRRPLPQTSGEIGIVGLDARVTIYRDEWGVPHIYAETAEDLFLAQGYVHAQDRWWQMEMNRHIAGGRISQIMGNDIAAQQTDRFIRLAGWHLQAAHSNKTASRQTDVLSQAYAAGINAYVRDRPAGDLAVEYTILGLTGRGFEIEPWQTLDTHSLAVLFAAGLDGNTLADLHRLTRLATLPQGLRADVSPIALPSTQDDLPTLLANLPLPDKRFLPYDLSAVGQGWAIDAARSTTAAPMLAADFSHPSTIPTGWYEIGLHCIEVTPQCPYNMVGMSIPGLPGVVSGLNESLAWALTTPQAPPDESLFWVMLNDENPRQYRFDADDDWQDLQPRNETLFINDAESLNWVAYDLAEGVLLTDPVRLETELALGLRWSMSGVGFVEALLAANQADTWLGFGEALAAWQTPLGSFLYADTSGQIGILHLGQNAPDNPFSPAVGVLVASQNAEYLTTWLNRDTLHNSETFSALQADTYSAFAAQLMPHILGIDFSDEVDTQWAEQQDWLAEWDFFAERESPYPMFFAIFWTQLVEQIFDDQLTPPAQGLQPTRDLVLRLLDEPDSLWWDDAQTVDSLETREDILRRAFMNAVETIRDEFGAVRSRWRWGDIHQVDFRGIPLGDTNVAAMIDLFNREDIGAGGGLDTVFSTPWVTNRSARNRITQVPAYRLIIDLSDFENSRSILATGQSGHPASENYDDMIPLWSTVTYRNILWTPESVRDASQKILRLRPALPPPPNDE